MPLPEAVAQYIENLVDLQIAVLRWQRRRGRPVGLVDFPRGGHGRGREREFGSGDGEPGLASLFPEFGLVMAGEFTEGMGGGGVEVGDGNHGRLTLFRW